jgi:DNA replication and repair protein RadA
VKNRFGAVNELGVFGMTDRGLKEVSNPSAIFLNRTQEEVPGSRGHGHLGRHPANVGGGAGAGR